MHKIFLLGLLTCTLVNAEIVKNAKGEKVELRADGTWVLVPKTFGGFVNDRVSYQIELADGNESKVAVKVYPDITLKDEGRKLTRDEVNRQILVLSIMAQSVLNNKSSFKPREVSVIQKGTTVVIKLSFTSQNESGTDVYGVRIGNYYVEEKSELKRALLMSGPKL